MKKPTLTFIMLMFAASVSFASTPGKAVWECSAYDVEGATITEINGQLLGDLSWDCFPGGGICNAKANVTVARDRSNDLVFRGPYFWLIIHTSVAPVNGAYQAHLIAKDKVDSSDMGRDMLFNSFLMCKPGR